MRNNLQRNEHFYYKYLRELLVFTNITKNEKNI